MGSDGSGEGMGMMNSSWPRGLDRGTSGQSDGRNDGCRTALGSAGGGDPATARRMNGLETRQNPGARIETRNGIQPTCGLGCISAFNANE